MKLEEYLTQVENAMAREENWADLAITSSNQLIYVGGSFNDLIRTMLKGRLWKTPKIALDEKSYKEELEKFLFQRELAYKQWENAEPRPTYPGFIDNYLRTWKEEIYSPRDSISLYHKYPIEALIDPINDINYQERNPPSEEFKTRIVLNGGRAVPQDSSVRGILYFGRYALKRRVPFAVVGSLYEPPKFIFL